LGAGAGLAAWPWRLPWKKRGGCRGSEAGTCAGGFWQFWQWGV
jgi:hypothetical protein